MIYLLLEVLQVIFDFKMEVFSHFLQKLKSGNLEEIREVITREPECLNYQDEGSKRTPIFNVASYYEDTLAMQVLQLMIKFGANIQHEDVNKRTITFVLCSRGMINCLKMLQSKYQQILIHKDRLGQTPLFTAVRENQFDLIRQLQLSADLINMTDEIVGQTILFYAAACGHEKLCKHLIKRGADLLIQDLCGQNISSYTQKMPNLHRKIRNKIRKLENEKGNEQSSSIEDKDYIVGKQAYQINFIEGNKIKRINEEQKEKFIKQLARLQKKQRPNMKESYLQCERLKINQYDKYHQNWRHFAIKIINGCLRIKCGKWFQHVLKAEEHLSEKDKAKIKGLDLIDIDFIKTKLQHNAYANPQQFKEDITKVWKNCQKINNPNSLIYKYAKQLRVHIHQQMVQYNLFKRY